MPDAWVAEGGGIGGKREDDNDDGSVKESDDRVDALSDSCLE